MIQNKNISIKIQFEHITLQQCYPLVLDYLSTLRGVIDDFLEKRLLTADWYHIKIEDKICGFFTIWEAKTITCFYLPVSQYVQVIFEHILQQFQIHSALVTTGDQLFLSLCLDFHKKIELQAYLFDGTQKYEVAPPKYPRNQLELVTSAQLSKMRELTGTFFDEFTDEDFRAQKQFFYCLRHQQQPLGYGVIVPNQLQTGYCCCGMITLAAFRRQGVGRSIQMHLADICREQHKIPISGCWYQNIASKSTIESAGRYSKTRTLHILF